MTIDFTAADIMGDYRQGRLEPETAIKLMVLLSHDEDAARDMIIDCTEQMIWDEELALNRRQ